MRRNHMVRAVLLLFAIAYTGNIRGIAPPGGDGSGAPMQHEVMDGAGTPVDVSPFGTIIEEGRGIRWEDPREIHRVVVRFRGAAPEARLVRLEYWTSRWPEQRLPKDRQPGGGDVRQALRALFNAIAVGYFPDTGMLTEHSLPNPGDWRGDHYKSSDEANAAGWLRQMFVREEGEELWLGQAVPREWLGPGKRCGLERAATYFGPVTVLYEARKDRITARVNGPRRNPPRSIRVRFRNPGGRPLRSVSVKGKPWSRIRGEWALHPGDVGNAEIVATWPGHRNAR